MKQTLSKAGTIAPFLNSPKWPPFLPDGQLECFFANTSNLAPLFNCLIISSASSLCLTKICSAAAVFAISKPISIETIVRIIAFKAEPKLVQNRIDMYEWLYRFIIAVEYR